MFAVPRENRFMDKNAGIWLSIPWKGITERTKDLVLATVITLIGLVGSYLILGGSIHEQSSSVYSPHTSQSGFGSSSGRLNLNSDEKLVSESDLLQIQGSFKPNETLSFYFTSYRPEQRYMIDFGNGMRQMMVQARIHMKYAYTGIYLVQLFEMKEGKWVLIATQSLNIKNYVQGSLSFL